MNFENYIFNLVTIFRHIENRLVNNNCYQWILFGLCAAFVSGCSPKSEKNKPMQVDGEEAIPSRLPTADEMYKITAPEYKLLMDAKSECLGRLIFTVNHVVEWPVYFNKENPDGVFNRSFEPQVAAAGDVMRFGTTYIAVIGSIKGIEKERVFRSTPASLEAFLQKSINESREYIERQRKDVKNPEVARKKISEAEEWIQGWEKTIKEDREKFEPFDPGLSDSEGYWTSETEGGDETNRYSILRVYLKRGEYIYIFESVVKMNTLSDKDKHKSDFSQMLANFRTRAANEIPSEPGVCFPFGFIPDDGRTVVEFKQSLRFHDAPAVLYTIETGTVHPRRLKTTVFMAAATSSMNPPPASETSDVRAVVMERIGPHSTQMGGVKAMQGGVVMKAEAKGIKYDVYDVYSGYSGWLGTAVLPYMLVEMQTVNMQQATELKHYPPPYEQSKERLDVMLKSMRWRPTNPPMSEFVKK
ncbi:T6SS immunity protein Tli4 family protein [Massilia brevitalea]|uniref:T6SS immunity protein Tli4 family protein n=1 Tax=Massilia brevitalea TaxID=442526 RepID=UPI002738A1AF|nr:T6SS immunity protein Tli4 family protein [Massilia brevitalea]